MKKLFCLLLLAVVLNGCATMFEDVKIYQAEQQGLLKVGMPYNEVVKLVGREPNTLSDYCRKENRSDGEYFTWIVNGGSMGTNFARTYKFEFKEWRLSSWSVQ